jgi:hypothetical protein
MTAVASNAPLISRVIKLFVTRIPGVVLVSRAIDFFIGDPLHHYMETGMLRGIKARAEQAHRGASEISGRGEAGAASS